MSVARNRKEIADRGLLPAGGIKEVLYMSKKICFFLQTLFAICVFIYVFFYISDVLSEFLAFSGEPPYQWPEGESKRAADIFVPQAVLSFALIVLNIKIFLLRKMKRLRRIHEKCFFVATFAIAVIQAFLTFIRFYTYRDWTICYGTEPYLVDGHALKMEPFFNMAIALAILILVFSTIICWQERHLWTKCDPNEEN